MERNSPCPPWFSRAPHSVAVLSADEMAELAAARIVELLRAALAPSSGRTPLAT